MTIHRNNSAVSKARRLTVFDRDGSRCVQCGRDDGLTIDHIVPRCLGGSNETQNLQTLCWWCNNKKGSWPYASVRDFVPDREVRVPRALPKFNLTHKRTKRRAKTLQRGHYWAMMALKYPMAFSADQPTYAPKERLRLRNLVGSIRCSSVD